MKHLDFNKEVLLIWNEVDPDNWHSIVIDIVDLFLDKAELQQQQLMHEWRENNLAEVARLAHTLKSSTGNVGAERAHQLFVQIEALAVKRQHLQLAVVMKEIELIFRVALEDLQAFRKQMLGQVKVYPAKRSTLTVRQ